MDKKSEKSGINPQISPNLSGADAMEKNLVLYDALRLETDAKAMERELIVAITQSKISSSCYAFKSRVKPEDKLYEKLCRKQKTKPSYKLTDITDVIGLRLVTLFRKEMPDVLESVIALITHENNLYPNPFVKGSIEQLIIYSTNPTHDTIAHKISAILDGNNIQYKLDGTSASYSSVHIVSRVNKNTKLEHHACSVNIPVEIQIRTVFEDAWGEVDHKFGYVIRTGKEAGKPVGNASMVQEHLKVLKKFSDACAEYADIIFSEAVPQVNKPIIEGRVISVGSDSDILQRFTELSLPDTYSETYIEGRELRDAALAQMGNDPDVGRRELIKAADFFKSLGDAISNDGDSPNDATRLFLYYVRMNEGLCLLSTNARDGVELANRIYASLEDEYPDYPLVKFRYGQALGKLGYSDLAITKFREAKGMIAELKEKFNTVPSDKLPKDDREHIEKLLPKLLGFQLWANSEKVPIENISERASLLAQAFNETKPLLGLLPDDISVHNNLVYYAVDYSELKPEDAPTEFTEQLKESLKFLESKNVHRESSDIEVLDTLLRAYIFFEMQEMAQETAARILALWEGGAVEVKVLDNDVVMEIVKLSYKTRKLN